jgi:hypothetical protein
LDISPTQYCYFVAMLSASFGLVVALASTFCDRALGAAFFQRSTFRFVLDHHSQRPSMKIWSKHRNLLETLRGGSTDESPSENEENPDVEEVLYLPGLLDVHIQLSQHVS